MSRLDGLAAAEVLGHVIRSAAVGAFGAPLARRPPTTSNPGDSPWFRHCRRAHFNLQDSLYSTLDASEQRRRRNLLNREKRRAMRRLRARPNAAFLDNLRHDPRRFWSGFKQGARDTTGGHTWADRHRHWALQFGGVGRGALWECGAASIRDFLAALEAAAGRQGLPPERRAAAQALNAPITLEEVEQQLRCLRGGAAAGLDGLGADLLKGTWKWEQLPNGKRRKRFLPVEPMALLFNRVFETSYPDSWNDTPLTSVFKGKGSETDLGKLPSYPSSTCPCTTLSQCPPG